jgi:hypothetical protein
MPDRLTDVAGKLAVALGKRIVVTFEDAATLAQDSRLARTGCDGSPMRARQCIAPRNSDLKAFRANSRMLAAPGSLK